MNSNLNLKKIHLNKVCRFCLDRNKRYRDKLNTYNDKFGHEYKAKWRHDNREAINRYQREHHKKMKEGLNK